MLGFFERITQKIGEFFGPATDIPPAPRGPGPYRTPGAIANFVAAATTPGGEQDLMMGDLRAQGINPEDFGRFCAGFAEGVEYIYRKYGTVPAGIAFEDADQPERTTRYNVASRTIFINRAWVGRAVNNYLNGQAKTDPYLLNPEQMALAYGVEEAFHHYQLTVHGTHYDDAMRNYQRWEPGSASTGYYTNPIETDAEAEVREALQYYRFDQMPKRMNWQEKMANQPAPAPALRGV